MFGRKLTQEEREDHFWRYVYRSGECWLWKGSIKKGYGYFWDGTRKVAAHRYIYEQIYGPIEEGLIIGHSCDTPACVNPSHLWKGTQADNGFDASRKGRMSEGQKRRWAKIRAQYSID